MNTADDILAQTSRTFYIPISQLPSGLHEAVMSAYLCMRAIDEIEDDPALKPELKANLLTEVSEIITRDNYEEELKQLFEPHKHELKEVSLRLSEWIDVCPASAKQAVVTSTATMAEGMAKWVLKDWKIETKEDIDDYTYYVAGLVGTLLSDLWFWYDDIKTNRDDAVAFGRGLQAVNILRNRDEDLRRGVDFFPNGWDKAKMQEYARNNLEKAMEYSKQIDPGPVQDFCMIPLMLALATLDTISQGKEKLSRSDVKEIVSEITGE
jgi:farnesyl-diphosphate farnesyltransferase